MPSGAFTAARGRINGLVQRVIDGDPATAKIMCVALSSAEPDATLKTRRTAAEVFAQPANVEATNTGYARLPASSFSLFVDVDDFFNWANMSFFGTVFENVEAGERWVKLLLCYDPNAAATVDANVIPLTFHDYFRTPRGQAMITVHPGGSRDLQGSRAFYSVISGAQVSVFNISKGKVNEYVARVIAGDPTNCALVVVLLSAAEADATLEDYDDLGALLGAAGNTETVNAGYARKVITSADPALALIPDDAGNRQLADFSDQTWASIAAGADIVKALVCYDPDTTGGTDSSIVPLCFYNFQVTPDGGPVPLTLPADGFYAGGVA